jgi:hypothetical protein
MRKSEIFNKMSNCHNQALLLPEGHEKSYLNGQASAYADMIDMINLECHLPSGSIAEVLLNTCKI